MPSAAIRLPRMCHSAPAITSPRQWASPPHSGAGQARELSQSRSHVPGPVNPRPIFDWFGDRGGEVVAEPLPHGPTRACGRIDELRDPVAVLVVDHIRDLPRVRATPPRAVEVDPGAVPVGIAGLRDVDRRRHLVVEVRECRVDRPDVVVGEVRVVEDVALGRHAVAVLEEERQGKARLRRTRDLGVRSVLPVDVAVAPIQPGGRRA